MMDMLFLPVVLLYVFWCHINRCTHIQKCYYFLVNWIFSYIFSYIFALKFTFVQPAFFLYLWSIFMLQILIFNLSVSAFYVSPQLVYGLTLSF